jgi:hypothetical protein
MGDPVSDLHRVTVTDRQMPLVTAAYGTRVARPAKTTVARGGNGSQLAQRVRPSSVTAASWARARRARGSMGYETRTPQRASPPEVRDCRRSDLRLCMSDR